MYMIIANLVKHVRSIKCFEIYHKTRYIKEIVCGQCHTYQLTLQGNFQLHKGGMNLFSMLHRVLSPKKGHYSNYSGHFVQTYNMQIWKYKTNFVQYG